MNERLKELAEQATKEVWGNNPFNGAPEFDGYELDPEKFAELIIRECGYRADVFAALGCPVDMDPTETKPSDYIKKHFGVE